MHTVGQTLNFHGYAEEVKVIFKEMQQFLGQSIRKGATTMQTIDYQTPKDTSPPPPPSLPQQVVFKEVVKIRCPYCKSLMPEDSNHCTECGAPLR